MLPVERLSLLRFLGDMSNPARIAHREDFSWLTTAPIERIQRHGNSKNPLHMRMRERRPPVAYPVRQRLVNVVQKAALTTRNLQKRQRDETNKTAESRKIIAILLHLAYFLRRRRRRRKPAPLASQPTRFVFPAPHFGFWHRTVIRTRRGPLARACVPSVP